MKLKEKINKEIEDNEALSLLKGLWVNKRYRSIFWLIIYFIFFFVVITSFRMDYNEQNNNLNKQDENINVSEFLQTLNNYSYEISLNGGNPLIMGNVTSNINSFTYNGDNYIIVADSVYLENETTLTKVDLTQNTDLIIPLNKITIDKIEDYIKDLEPISKDGKVSYNLNINDIFEMEEVTFVINFYGKEKIELDFSDYAKQKDLNYEEYIITIRIGGK
ncbi:MAG: hypothetical protein E7165_01945 [Firmicutes bacterium]|nr:hypothetical protein [Bacillota bacterium]